MNPGFPPSALIDRISRNALARLARSGSSTQLAESTSSIKQGYFTGLMEVAYDAYDDEIAPSAVDSRSDFLSASHFCITVVAIVLASGRAFAVAPTDTISRDVAVLVKSNCHGCHNGTDAKAALNLEKLGSSLSDFSVATAWIRVHDKVASGEMPPKDAEQPTQEQRTRFLDRLRESLHAASLARQRAEGRAVVRRLNRIECETTLKIDSTIWMPPTTAW